jgi:hypothetical protein
MNELFTTLCNILESNDLNDIPINDQIELIKKKNETDQLKATQIRNSTQIKRAILDTQKLKDEIEEYKENKAKKNIDTEVYPNPLKEVDVDKFKKSLQNVKESEEDLEDDENLENKESEVTVAGSEPQTKEQANIALLQAKTREIQSKIGEYGDVSAAETQMDPTLDPNMDPNSMSMGGMGQEPEDPNDPLRGLGSTPDMFTGMPVSRAPTLYGRMLLLKKILKRLLFLKEILEISSDPKCMIILKYVKDALEMLYVTLDNLKDFKENIDDLIIDYYTFTKECCNQILEVQKGSKSIKFK